MNKEDKLVLGTLAGLDLILSPEHYEEYKGTLQDQLEEKDKEIERLQNIINELEKELNKKIEAIKTINDMLGKEAKIVNPHIEVLETEYKYFLDKLKELKEGNNGSI